MSKDKEIIIPIPEEHREKLTELLKAYQPQRKALKEIETLGAKYGKQSINDIQYTSDAYLKDVEKICSSAKTKAYTKPHGSSENTIAKYQAIVDMLYDLGHYSDQIPRGVTNQLFAYVADFYPELNWQSIRRIARKNITPTKLKTSKK